MTHGIPSALLAWSRNLRHYLMQKTLSDDIMLSGGGIRGNAYAAIWLPMVSDTGGGLSILHRPSDWESGKT
jgi:hypothetical protein